MITDTNPHPAGSDEYWMYRALQLKQDHPLPGTAILPEAFDFSLDRKQQCPRIDAYENFERAATLWQVDGGQRTFTREEAGPPSFSSDGRILIIPLELRAGLGLLRDP